MSLPADYFRCGQSRINGAGSFSSRKSSLNGRICFDKMVSTRENLDFSRLGNDKDMAHLFNIDAIYVQ